MRRIFAIVLRSLWVIVVYLIAAYVAGAVVTLSAGTEWTALRDPHLDPTTAMVETVLLVGLAGSYLGAAFLIPATVAIIASEVFSIRGALAHLLGGLAVAAVSSTTTNIVLHTHASAFRAWELLLAAGVLSGAVYWLLAGRNAGRWQDVGQRPQAPQRDHADEGA